MKAKRNEATLSAAETFENRRDAWKWLRDNGLEMSESTFYRQVGQPGFPSLLSGKRISRLECSEFLRRQLEAKGATVPHQNDLKALQLRQAVADTTKKEADASIAQVKAANLARRHDKEWMPRVEAYAIMAALAGLIKEEILHELRHGQLELVAVCQGKEERAPELYEALARRVAAALNRIDRLDETLDDYEDEPEEGGIEDEEEYGNA